MGSKKTKIGKKACVKLARELARTTGVCAFCGKTKDEVQIQAAHIIPEDHHWTSFNLDNMIELCASHHKWSRDSWHKHPLLMSGWFMKQFPGRWQMLQDYTKVMVDTYGPTPNWPEVMQMLKEIKKARKKEEKNGK